MRQGVASDDPTTDVAQIEDEHYETASHASTDFGGVVVPVLKKRKTHLRFSVVGTFATVRDAQVARDTFNPFNYTWHDRYGSRRTTGTT